MSDNPFPKFLDRLLDFDNIDERTLARRIHVRLQTVQRWRAGTQKPATVGQIERLATFARIQSRLIFRVAWNPWGPPAEHESDDPLRDASFALVWRQLSEALNTLPEAERESAFRNYQKRLEASLDAWRPSFREAAPPTWRDQVAALMADAPTDEAQLATAHLIAAALEPIRAAFDLPPYTIQLTRRRTVLGYCHHPPHEENRPHAIHVRCTPSQLPDRWFTLSTIIYIHCHEMAHLRQLGHNRDFWDLTRSLVDAAADAGIYDRKAVPVEWELARGDLKLARSSAASRAVAARAVHRSFGEWRAHLAELDTPENRAAAATLVVGRRYRLEQTHRMPQLEGALVTVRAVASHWAECELDNPELAEGRRVLAQAAGLVPIDR